MGKAKANMIFDSLKDSLNNVLNFMPSKDDHGYNLMTFISFKNKSSMNKYCMKMQDICDEKAIEISAIYNLKRDSSISKSKKKG